MTNPKTDTRPYNQTVIGCFEEPEEGNFVEHVKANSAEGAVREAIKLDPCREEARIIAVFYGRQYDVLPSEVGVPKWGIGFKEEDKHDGQPA